MLTRAATRGAERPLVVADMPFGSYQVSDEEAVRNAVRFVKEAGADAVKLEGAGPSLSRVRRARRRRHARHGPSRPDAAVRDHARRLPGAGPDGGEGARSSWTMRSRWSRRAASPSCSRRCRRPSATRISDELAIPTIGIGSGAGCDGQVLVFHDLLGLYEGRSPRFSSATRRSARDPAGRSSASPTMCAPAPSPRRRTRTRCPRRS